jgi:two-component system, sensor histidine kinase and response regulator
VPLDDQPVLDTSVLDELAASVGGDRTFVVDLIQAYLADGAQQVEAIATAIGEGRADAVVRPAHTLKSSSATLGAERLAARSRALEQAGRSGTLDGEPDGPGVDALRADWDAAAAALRDWVAENRSR